MKAKLAFIAGAGIGYVLGTRAGRQQFEAIQGWSRSVWQDPRVQSQVNDLEAKASDLAKTEGAALKDKVTVAVKSVVDAVKDKSSDSA
ncbi:YtxH domain-containing protein [Pengzhenrongella sicca]|uniref:YtxH domain-containing protein n=1 Tax=Pengzhenrongella sicca TaxID=2819238 RepID=A0A8A4ZF90_9MICO|nr:YtxH domain-containing protein [Pengzhenrongella sicca]QTE29583.1 YtxH domain-containing protein [Pengzhenrongella sicca]